ncbi:MAG: glycerol-3-phosphate dehydrogenase/oxidase [Vicinamibacterales bacterium]
MIRDLARLANEAFDVLVIGGGIYGLATVRELVARGLSVALVERGDFAAATSFNSLKTVHGGIRALQHGAIPAVREFVRERRGLAAIAPHLVCPLPFVVPTYRHPLRNRPLMAAFLTAYDFLAADRNDGIDVRLALPRSRTISRDECLRLNPVVDSVGVTGGAVWHDYQLHSPERLAIGLLDAAVRSGVAAANYTEAQRLLQQGREIHGVTVRDVETGSSFDIRCRIVLNAAGPWAWPVLQQFGAVPGSIRQPRMSLAMNLVTDRAPLPQAVGGLVDGRFLFLVPWREQSMIGTSHDLYSGSPDDVASVDVAVERFLRDAKAAFPEFPMHIDTVRLIHRGLLPAGPDGSLLTQSIIHDHLSDGLGSLVTVLGVRYTTARATAAAAAELVATKLGKPSGRQLPSLEPISGGDITDLDRYEHEAMSTGTVPPSTVRRLIAAYGSRYDQIVRLMGDNPTLGAPLSSACRVTRAEVVYSVREEMAIHLSDVLLRRTEAGTGGHPGEAAIQAAAEVMANELGWSASRAEVEKGDCPLFPKADTQGKRGQSPF